ncbi:MAG: asparagine synthase (glutamine-hydrolyzing) [Myxococcota bacterium]|nr:asparagine synthase (glutamine-hydrolyzing) [Spirochaeta sp.]RPG07124.1 MAG: asparagine synthase (glutamine-hydrolyzing) [Proteobacteria bacterium TMED72]
MCGIAGILALNEGAPVAIDPLIRLRDAQTHRGPDDAGDWIDSERKVGLAHRRLSIIDLSASGHQPMHTKDHDLHIVFNGEIYNFQSLKKELEEAGHVFQSTSDTEVLLHGYREWKLDLLPRLRGMFAFGLHDSREKRTLLARDPLGIKPLYHAESERQFFFASEIQAIRSVTDGGGTDPEAVSAYLHWGYIAPPRTIYRRIRSLPPGHYMTIEDGSPSSPRPYYSLQDELGKTEDMDEREAADHIRESLLDSVRCHMVSDVEVGSFLSGGVDSSSLVGLMSEVQPGSISTVNLSFDVADYDEGDLATSAADFYGTRHHRIDIRLEDVREQIGESVRALDQPSVDGPNVYLVSKAAVEAGLKVAVAGVGGDELFAGYSTFKNVPGVANLNRKLEKVPGMAFIARSAASSLNQLPRNHRRNTLYRSVAYGSGISAAYSATRSLFTPRDVRDLLSPDYKAFVETTNPVRELESSLQAEQAPADQQVSFLEVGRYLQMQLLRDADVMSMRHSLEVRTPLVDHVLIRNLLKVPSRFLQAGPAKKALRNSARPGLPEVYWKRQKKGFTLPFDRWLRQGSLDLGLPEHPILDGKAVARLESDFRQSRVLWTRLWALYTLAPFLE